MAAYRACRSPRSAVGALLAGTQKSVHQRYGDLIDAMYDGARQVDARIAFQYEDGSQQRIELSIAINDAGGAEVPR